MTTPASKILSAEEAEKMGMYVAPLLLISHEALRAEVKRLRAERVPQPDRVYVSEEYGAPLVSELAEVFKRRDELAAELAELKKPENRGIGDGDILALIKERDQLQHQLSIETKKATGWALEVKALQEKLTLIQDAWTALAHEHDNHRDRAAELDQKLLYLRQEKQQLEDALAQAQETIANQREEWTTHLEQANQRGNRLEEERNVLRADLAQAKQQIEHHKAVNAGAIHELSEVEQELAQAKQELEKNKKLLTAVNIVSIEYQRWYKEEREKVSRLSQRCAELEQVASGNEERLALLVKKHSLGEQMLSEAEHLRLAALNELVVLAFPRAALAAANAKPRENKREGRRWDKCACIRKDESCDICTTNAKPTSEEND